MEEKQEKEVWTIDELVSMTETGQKAEIEYAGKLIAQERVNKMIAKANEKNPEGFCIPPEAWNKLPTTARWKITGQILGGDEDTAGNFTSG